MYSYDAAIGIEKVINKVKKTIILNLGSGKRVYMRNFVKTYWKILGQSEKKINFLKIERKSTNKGFYLDISLLKKNIGWKPQKSLVNNIKNNIKLFK